MVDSELDTPLSRQPRRRVQLLLALAFFGGGCWIELHDFFALIAQPSFPDGPYRLAVIAAIVWCAGPLFLVVQGQRRGMTGLEVRTKYRGLVWALGLSAAVCIFLTKSNRFTFVYYFGPHVRVVGFLVAAAALAVMTSLALWRLVSGPLGR
jgi:hypothetical protein